MYMKCKYLLAKWHTLAQLWFSGAWPRRMWPFRDQSGQTLLREVLCAAHLRIQINLSLGNRPEMCQCHFCVYICIYIQFFIHTYTPGCQVHIRCMVAQCSPTLLNLLGCRRSLHQRTCCPSILSDINLSSMSLCQMILLREDGRPSFLFAVLDVV